MSDTNAPVHPNKSILGNKFYDITKWCALIAFPALGALYFSLSDIWGLPNAVEVVGTVTVVDTFLGVILGVSSKVYNNSDARYDGFIAVSENSDGVKRADLILKNYEDPADVVKQKEVTFKVNKV